MKIKLRNIHQEKMKHILNFTGLIPKGVYLAGGCMRSLLDPFLTPVDYDFFFNSPEAKESFESLLVSLRYQVVWHCPRGELTTLKYKHEKVQLITPRYYNSLEDVVDSFDFTACSAGTDGNILYAHDKWAKHCLKKQLHMAGLEYPIATLRRMEKYKSYGFKVSEEFWIEFGELLAGRRWSADGMRLYID